MEPVTEHFGARWIGSLRTRRMAGPLFGLGALLLGTPVAWAQDWSPSAWDQPPAQASAPASDPDPLSGEGMYASSDPTGGPGPVGQYHFQNPPEPPPNPYLESSKDELLVLLQSQARAYDRGLIEEALGQKFFDEALALSNSGSRGRSMAAFRKAVYLAPRLAMLRYEYFEALRKQKRYEEALVQAEAFLELQPEGALSREALRQASQVHVSLGEELMKDNRWDAAIEHFEKVRQLSGYPDRFSEVEGKLAVCLYTLGVREAANKDRATAARYFSRLVGLRPENESQRNLFDQQFLDKLRTNGRSPLWNEGKEAKEAQRYVEAYRYLGDTLVLATHGWMQKLCNQYRAEILALLGPGVEVDAQRFHFPGHQPVTQGQAALPQMVSPEGQPLEPAPGEAGSSSAPGSASGSVPGEDQGMRPLGWGQANPAPAAAGNEFDSTPAPSWNAGNAP